MTDETGMSPSTAATHLDLSAMELRLTNKFATRIELEEINSVTTELKNELVGIRTSIDNLSNNFNRFVWPILVAVVLSSLVRFIPG